MVRRSTGVPRPRGSVTSAGRGLGRSYTALIDLVSYGLDGLALSAVRRGGKVASTLGAACEQALATVGLSGTNIMAGPVREVVTPLADRAAAGDLTVDVENRAAARSGRRRPGHHRRRRGRGRIVVKISDRPRVRPADPGAASVTFCAVDTE
jgi:hypothetical protein